MSTPESLRRFDPDEFMRRMSDAQANVASLGLLQAEQQLVNTLEGDPPASLSKAEQAEWRAGWQRALSELRRQMLALDPEELPSDQNTTCFMEASRFAIEGVHTAIEAAARAAVKQARVVFMCDHLRLEEDQP